MKQVFEQIGIPEVINHDNEGSWSSTKFRRLINQHKIKQTITSTPPPFAERSKIRYPKPDDTETCFTIVLSPLTWYKR